MTVLENGGVCAPKGFLAGGIHCGVRRNQSKRDLAMILSEKECAAAAVYTKNKVFGAPVAVCRENLRDGRAWGVVVNSGNANTCNRDGIADAQRMCEAAAKATGHTSTDFAVASTGVIGVPLPIVPVEDGIAALGGQLTACGGHDAALAIMTTDTIPKEYAVQLVLDGKTVTIGAMAKGEGMIHPNMGTMLSFVTTDCAISAAMLQKALSDIVEDSFNMISIDGDTSTNDTLCVLANGMAENSPIEGEGDAYASFRQALLEVCVAISRMIAGDGEGATKRLECSVTGAPSKETARKIAKSVICSSLVKTMIFGADANWGRVLCAIGYTDAEFDVSKIAMRFVSENGVLPTCEDGFGIPFDEDFAKAVLTPKKIRIEIDMNQGGGEATAWGCDLTYDYVKINGDYRT